MKILIVDDFDDMRRLLRIVLGGKLSAADEVIECADGAEAVELFRSHRPDYVLMDVQLKGMDGFTAAEKMYQHDPEARIIFVTSYDTPVFRARAAAMGAKGFVPKDNLSEIVRLIQP
ncbi:MAG: response regulator transcription factor [Bacteroidota bacterium]|jgi:CheY-like chemotaxis protein